MRIVGFNISKILAERKNPIKDKLEIKSNVNIKDIQKEEIPITKSSALKFEFEFTIDYAPKIAEVVILGSVLVIDEKDESKDILKDWKKKKFSHPMKLPLFNFIMDKCNLKALQLEEEINLPLHLPLPKIRPQQEQDQPANYAG